MTDSAGHMTKSENIADIVCPDFVHTIRHGWCSLCWGRFSNSNKLY